MMRRSILPILAAVATLAAFPRTRAEDAPALDKIILEDLEGKKRSVGDAKDAKAVVLFFIGSECPNVARYAERVKAAAAAWKGRGVVFAAVDSNAPDTRERVKAHAREHGYTFPVVLDPEQLLADRLGVTVTPCVVVLDAKRTVRYRGSVDDNKVEELSRRKWLAEALEAVTSGRDPATKETHPQGCLIQRAPRAPSKDGPTWSGEVGAIIFRSCTPCHRPGQVAPFPITNYEEARRWAPDVKRYTQARVMPPWKPIDRGVFRDERCLKDAEIDLLARWADAGAPLGDAAKAPAAPKFPEGWQLGVPDLVLDCPEYAVPANGSDEYRCYVLKPGLTEDKWIAAVELKPGNPAVVHHVLGYLDTSGEADRLDANDPLPGYRSPGTSPGFYPSGEMGGWAPGSFAHPLPDGVGRFLPKEARLVLQVHYHKNGKSVKDRTQIGLHFSKTPVKQGLRWVELVDSDLKIPAGATRHTVTKNRIVREDSDLLAVMPHMHLLGREAKLEATMPDGTVKTLIHIPEWDFNWQDYYFLKEPLFLPAGTKLTGTMIYDNSSENPNNPNDPPRMVRWGEQTTDEMFLFYVGYIKAQKAERPAAVPGTPVPAVPAKPVAPVAPVPAPPAKKKFF